MATWYIAKTGSNANSGASLALAKLTVGAGVALGTSGDTYNIGPGTYYGVAFDPTVNSTYRGHPSGTFLSGAVRLANAGFSGAGAAWKCTTGHVDGGSDVALGFPLNSGHWTATFATSVMTVTGGIVGGTPQPGAGLYCVGVPAGVWITSQLTGTTGSTGTYQLSATVGTLGSRTVYGTQEVQTDTLNPLAALYMEDLFVDGAQYTRVATLAAVGASTWFWDMADNSVNVNSNLNGHIVELSRLNSISSTPAGGVIWRDLVVEKYTPGFQSAPIHNVGIAVFVGATFRWNHGAGLVPSIFFPTVIRNCRFNDNGNLGISIAGDDVQILNCEIARNNNAGYNHGNAGGGVKMFGTNIVINGCWVHDNQGPGLWCDTSSADVTYANNFVDNNVSYPNPLGVPSGGSPGIFHETAYGITKIYGNVVTRHGPSTGFAQGASGILISNSSDVEVWGNIVTVGIGNASNNGGINAVNTARGSDDWGVVWSCLNLNVHDNIVIHSSDTAQDGIYNDQALIAPNNVWDRNIYFVPNLTGTFWMFDVDNGTGNDTPRTFASAQTRGYELNSLQIIGNPVSTPAGIATALSLIADGQAAGAISALDVRTEFYTWLTRLALPMKPSL